eukprot:COSAG02_NODE_16796_length_1055_cov_1.063808_2_plen_185_part_01
MALATQSPREGVPDCPLERQAQIDLQLPMLVYRALVVEKDTRQARSLLDSVPATTLIAASHWGPSNTELQLQRYGNHSKHDTDLLLSGSCQVRAVRAGVDAALMVQRHESNEGKLADKAEHLSTSHAVAVDLNDIRQSPNFIQHSALEAGLQSVMQVRKYESCCQGGKATHGTVLDLLARFLPND